MSRVAYFSTHPNHIKIALEWLLCSILTLLSLFSKPSSSLHANTAATASLQLFDFSNRQPRAGFICVSEVVASVIPLRKDAVFYREALRSLLFLHAAFVEEVDEVLASMPCYHRSSADFYLRHAHLAPVHAGRSNLKIGNVHHNLAVDEFRDRYVAAFEPTFPLDSKTANLRHRLPGFR